MISSFVNYVGHISIGFGLIFCIIGAIGLLRLPDVFSRMHGAGIIDTLGIGLILLGLIFFEGFSLISAKLLMILVFVFFSSPTASHALARSALNGGIIPEVENDNVNLPVDSYEND